jgi:hypothetical protein
MACGVLLFDGIWGCNGHYSCTSVPGAIVKAHCCYKTLQYLKDTNCMNKMLSIFVFSAGGVQVMYRRHTCLKILQLIKTDDVTIITF